MFQIKICGIKSVKDARFASLAGADAIGLNFYENSPRYIDPTTAESVIPAIPPKVAKIGVFVNAAVDQLNETAERLGLDYLQLHGDEPPEVLKGLADHKVIRAFRCGPDGFTAIIEYLESCQALGRGPDAVLLDADQPGEYGGTGKSLDWNGVAASRDLLNNIPLVLAGGLTPFNVAEAIRVTRPEAVDVASGVESSAGTKDPLLIRAFCTAAKKEFAQG